VYPNQANLLEQANQKANPLKQAQSTTSKQDLNPILTQYLKKRREATKKNKLVV